MNCAESQDLLLDLAYGELPPARAAEVEAHVQGCAACRAEKAELDDARKAAAPLRELEEPPAGFDDPILRAARAEAGLLSEGTPGPVVEVSATVKPLGLQAARLDPHAKTRSGKARPPPRWGRRVAAIGSVAAAAGLAVVVTSSLRRQTAPHSIDEVPPIQVRAPGAPVPISVDDALSPPVKAAAPKASSGASSQKAVPLPQGVPPEASARKKVASPAEPVKEKVDQHGQPAPAIKKEAEQLIGFGGSPKREDKAVERPAVRALAPGSRSEPPPADRYADEPKPAAGLHRASGDLQAMPAAPLAAQQVPAGQAVAAAKAKAAAPDPDHLEDQAGAARRRGDYARAAALYRDASALRRQSDPARAAWDMAHAVECLAAGGQMDEAIAARKELLRLFPGQSGPKSAADSALRSVRLPADEKPAVEQ